MTVKSAIYIYWSTSVIKIKEEFGFLEKGLCTECGLYIAVGAETYIKEDLVEK